MQALLNSPKVKSSLQMVKSWAPLWIGTTLLFGGLGTVYSMFLKKDMWLASQGILVRDEATGGQARQGRFGSQTELKAAQETILDMARNHQVVRNAFLAAGPEESVLGTPSNWPSNTDIKNFVDQSLSVHAPRGGEFGSTEVVYVDVKHTNAERALILNKCVCDALDEYLKQVRETRAQSISDELTQTRDRARLELAKIDQASPKKLKKGVGSELTDLRSLAEIGGGSNSRGVLEQLSAGNPPSRNQTSGTSIRARHARKCSCRQQILYCCPRCPDQLPTRTKTTSRRLGRRATECFATLW